MVAALAAALVVACAPSSRSVEPPVVRLSGLSVLNPTAVEVDVMVTNLNPMVLDPQRAEVVIRINDQAFIDWEQTVDWTVSSNARDAVTFTAPASAPQVRQWLSQLSQGERDNLPWSIQMRLSWADDRSVETTASGWLYPRPGQPGQYR